MSLIELAERVEKAIGPDRALGLAIATASYELGFPIYGERVNYDPALWLERNGPLSASLDAAMTLVPEGWFWRVGHSTLYKGWAHLNRRHPDFCDREDEHSAQAATPALALCAASLRARAHAAKASVGDGE